MTVEQAHIEELKRQLATAQDEAERLRYRCGQLKTEMVEWGVKQRADEKAQWEPIYAAARDVLGACIPSESEDPAGRVVYFVPATQLAALRAALEEKRPTPGVYVQRVGRVTTATKYILRKGDAGFVYFYREGDACWTQDKDAAKRFDTATQASMFAISHGLGGVEVELTT